MGIVFSTFLSLICGYLLNKYSSTFHGLPLIYRIIIYIIICIITISTGILVFDNEKKTDQNTQTIAEASAVLASDKCKLSYKISTTDNKQNFSFIAGEPYQINFNLSYMSGDLNIGDKVICNIVFSGYAPQPVTKLKPGESILVSLSGDLKPGEINPQLECSTGKGKINCRASELEDKSYNVTISDTSDIKVLGIDMTYANQKDALRDQNENIINCDDFDLGELRNAIEGMSGTIKTMYSTIPCCNEKWPQNQYKQQGILFFNNLNSRYINENGEESPILLRIKDLIQIKHYSYLSGLSMLDYTQEETNRVISDLRLSDCSKDGNCSTDGLGFSELELGNDPNKSNLFSPNIFNFEKYPENKDIDFVFFLPYKQKGVNCSTGSL